MVQGNPDEPEDKFLVEEEANPEDFMFWLNPEFKISSECQESLRYVEQIKQQVRSFWDHVSKNKKHVLRSAVMKSQRITVDEFKLASEVNPQRSGPKYEDISALLDRYYTFVRKNLIQCVKMRDQFLTKKVRGK